MAKILLAVGIDELERLLEQHLLDLAAPEVLVERAAVGMLDPAFRRLPRRQDVPAMSREPRRRRSPRTPLRLDR